MDISQKCEFMNILLKVDFWNFKHQSRPKYEVLNKKTMRMIYFHIMLENLSMFFYKSDDSIYMLEALLSQLNQTSS